MDPLSNMLSHLKNSLMVQKRTCAIPHSKFKMEIAKILKESNLIEDYKKKTTSGKKNSRIILYLKYLNRQPLITDIKIVSKPSRHLYIKNRDLRYPKLGILILSTPKGVMTAREAKKRGLGGEIICQIT